MCHNLPRILLVFKKVPYLRCALRAGKTPPVWRGCWQALKGQMVSILGFVDHMVSFVNYSTLLKL